MTHSNRRSYPRVAAFITVIVYTEDGKKFRGEVEDLSLGGVFLRCPEHGLHGGQRVEVEFQFSNLRSSYGFVVEVDEIDSRGPLSLREVAVVRWIKGGHSFGLQFTSLSFRSRRFFKRLVKYFQKLKALDDEIQEIDHASGE